MTAAKKQELIYYEFDICKIIIYISIQGNCNCPILINFQHLVEVAGVVRSLAAGLETLSSASTADAALTRKPRPVSQHSLQNTSADFIAAARQWSRRLNALLASIFFSSHQQSDWPPGIYCLRRKLVTHFIASQARRSWSRRPYMFDTPMITCRMISLPEEVGAWHSIPAKKLFS